MRTPSCGSSNACIAPLGLRLDHASPMVDARLADGSRLHAVLPPLAPDGPCVTIRRFTLGRSASMRSVSKAAAVTSSTRWCGAGGTSGRRARRARARRRCCNALAHSIDAAERIVTIEETTELRLRAAACRPPRGTARERRRGGRGDGARARAERAAHAARSARSSARCAAAKRSTCCRRCNTGHDGSLSTVHANSPADALARLETLDALRRRSAPVAGDPLAARVRDRRRRPGRAERRRRPRRARHRRGRGRRARRTRWSSRATTGSSFPRRHRFARPGAPRSTSSGSGARATIAIALFGTGVSAWLARARAASPSSIAYAGPSRAWLPRGVRIRLARRSTRPHSTTRPNRRSSSGCRCVRRGRRRGRPRHGNRLRPRSLRSSAVVRSRLPPMRHRRAPSRLRGSARDARTGRGGAALGRHGRDRDRHGSRSTVAASPATWRACEPSGRARRVDT